MEQKTTDRKEFVPQLSIAERDKRWKAARERMVMHNLDCLLIWGNDKMTGQCEANLRYLTNIGTQRMGGGICVFPLESEPVIFLYCPIPSQFSLPFPVYSAFQTWLSTPNIRYHTNMSALVNFLKELGYEKSRIGLVDSSSSPQRRIITYDDYNTLAAEMPKASLVDATGFLEELRMVKSEEEINHLRKACHIAQLKIESMIAACKVGAKECEVYAKMVETDIANGGEAYIQNLMTSGSTIEPYTQHLLHGKGAPLSPTSRILSEGDLIISEFHTSYGGYLASAEKSVFIGKPPQQLQRIHDTAIECHKSGLDMIKPGVTVYEVWQAFYKPLKAASMSYLELGIHSHDLHSGSLPKISREPKTKRERIIADIELRENMVFATMVDIHDPAWRDDVGIMFGDTVLVTKTGSQTLVNTPQEFTCVH